MSARILEYNGESHRLCEWAILLGITKTSMDSRVRRYEKGGMKYADIFRKGQIDGSDRIGIREYEYNGISDTADGWAERIGITPSRFRIRMRKVAEGTLPDDIAFTAKCIRISKGNDGKTNYIHAELLVEGPGGRSMSLTEWGRECGVDPCSMKARFARWRSGKISDSELLTFGKIEQRNIRKIRVKGKTYTLEGLARRLDVSKNTLRGRLAMIKRGELDPSRLMTKGNIPVKDRLVTANKRYVAKDGTRFSIQELADIAQVSFDTIRRKLGSGMSVDEVYDWAKDPYRHVKGSCFFRGRKEKIGDAVSELGISGRTVSNRTQCGWTFRDAVSEGRVSVSESQRRALLSRNRNRRIKELKAIGVVV